MEVRIAERLRGFTTARTRFLESLAFSPSVLGTHWFLIMSTITVLVAIYGQIRQLTLFSMHPLCMTIGTLIFAAEGIISYKNKTLLETFGPLMANTRKMKVRAIHQTMQITAATFICLGIVFVAANKVEFGESLVPHTLHGVIGLTSLSVIIIQIIVGMQKMEYLEWSNTKIRRWHSDAGLLLWDLLCASVILGLLEFFSFSLLHLFVTSIVLLEWFVIHMAILKKKHIDADDGTNDGENGGNDPNGKLLVDNDMDLDDERDEADGEK